MNELYFFYVFGEECIVYFLKFDFRMWQEYFVFDNFEDWYFYIIIDVNELYGKQYDLIINIF